MTSRSNILRVILLALGVFFVTTPDSNLAKAESSGAATKPAAVPLTPLNAHDLKINLVKPGVKASVVALFTTWCEPCKREVPELMKIRSEQGSKGVQVFLIASDLESDIPEAAEFLAKLKVNFPAYKVGEPPDVFMKAFADDWPTLVPTTMLFDEKGALVAKWYGRFKIEKLHSRLKALLAKPSKGPVATQPKAKSH